VTPASQNTSVVYKKTPIGSANGAATGGSNSASVPTSGVGLLQSITDLTITLIKYELVFDEKVEGQYLKEKVLSKTM
jgi:formiminotetrahydrofolate cyclodeaminase